MSPLSFEHKVKKSKKNCSFSNKIRSCGTPPWRTTSCILNIVGWEPESMPKWRVFWAYIQALMSTLIQIPCLLRRYPYLQLIWWWYYKIPQNQRLHFWYLNQIWRALPRSGSRPRLCTPLRTPYPRFTLGFRGISGSISRFVFHTTNFWFSFTVF